MKCTRYELVDYHPFDERPPPCRCPTCGGFLKWDENTPICNKCHTELIMLPDIDEETGEEEEWGRICPISQPHSLSRKVRKEGV